MLKFVGNVGAFVNRFKLDEEAAVTVDWVVLTAGIVFMVALVVQNLTLPVEAISTTVSDGINQYGS